MSDQIDTRTGWMPNDVLNDVRDRVPLVYVDAVPVRVDEEGNVTHVGMLLRQAADGSISRMVVSGRVMLNERIREALIRHLEKDLGPLALPRIPPEPAPFTVVEYFQDPSISGFHDPRHHAVSLAYVVPVSGECQPTQQALELTWFTPTEAVSDRVRREMTGGHDRLTRELGHGRRLFFGFATEHLVDGKHATGNDCPGEAVLAMGAGDHAFPRSCILGFETGNVGVDVVVLVAHASSVPIM